MEFAVVVAFWASLNLVQYLSYRKDLRHASERQFLINAALSNTPQEFAIRQEATNSEPSEDEDEPYDAAQIVAGL